MFKMFVVRSSGKDWAFYRRRRSAFFWPKIDAEYQQEMQGIVEGLKGAESIMTPRT